MASKCSRRSSSINQHGMDSLLITFIRLLGSCEIVVVFGFLKLCADARTSSVLRKKEPLPERTRTHEAGAHIRSSQQPPLGAFSAKAPPFGVRCVQTASARSWVSLLCASRSFPAPEDRTWHRYSHRSPTWIICNYTDQRIRYTATCLTER